MPDYRRANTPGATWFFTVNLLQRHGNDLLVRNIERLKSCVLTEKARRPFSVLAWVVLPEHITGYGAFRKAMRISPRGGGGSRRISAVGCR